MTNTDLDTALYDMGSTIEDLSRIIPEGEYLKLYNTLMKVRSIAVHQLSGLNKVASVAFNDNRQLRNKLNQYEVKVDEHSKRIDRLKMALSKMHARMRRSFDRRVGDRKPRQEKGRQAKMENQADTLGDEVNMEKLTKSVAACSLL